MRDLKIPNGPDHSAPDLTKGWATVSELYAQVDALHEAVEEALAMDDPDAEDRAVRELWG